MATKQIDSEVANEELQQYLFHLADNQQEFIEKLHSNGYGLDYSLDNLIELERYVKDMGEQIAWKNKAESAAYLRLGVWSYIGETFRRNFGGGWLVSLHDSDSIYYGKWVISGFGKLGLEFDPIGTMISFLLRGKPSIRSMMESHVHIVPLDLTHLPEED